MKRGVFVVMAMLLAASAALNVPIFAWSGSSYFSGKNQQIAKTTAFDELQNIVDYAISGVLPTTSTLQSAIGTSDKKPSVVVLFLEPELRTDQISQQSKSFAALKSLVETEASSIVAPWVSMTSQDIIERKADRIVLNAARAVVAAGGRVLLKATAGSTLESLLVSNMDVTLFSDAKSVVFGERDLVIVQLTNSAHEDNDVVAEISAAIKTATNGNYIAVLTAESAADPGVQFSFKNTETELPRRPEWMERYALDATLESNGTTNGTTIDSLEAHFPYWFWEGFVFGIIFIWIAVCGTCTLMNVQTPDRFLGEVAKKQQ